MSFVNSKNNLVSLGALDGKRTRRLEFIKTKLATYRPLVKPRLKTLKPLVKPVSNSVILSLLSRRLGKKISPQRKLVTYRPEPVPHIEPLNIPKTFGPEPKYIPEPVPYIEPLTKPRPKPLTIPATRVQQTYKIEPAYQPKFEFEPEPESLYEPQPEYRPEQFYPEEEAYVPEIDSDYGYDYDYGYDTDLIEEEQYGSIPTESEIPTYDPEDPFQLYSYKGKLSGIDEVGKSRINYKNLAIGAAMMMWALFMLRKK